MATNAEHQKAWRQRNPEENRRRNRTNYQMRKERNRAYLRSFLLEHPCEGCGERDPSVLEFDHLDRQAKLKTVSDMALSASIAKLMAEVAKCRVLCANCHRRHTAKQMRWHGLQGSL